ncbi:MAG: DUF5107 domain-containing protein [Cyclobacteriaceae bacterium]
MKYNCNNLSSILRAAGLIIVFAVFTYTARSQKATVSEDTLPIETYAFNNPNPIPLLLDKPHVYPYHSFNGYSHDKKVQNWKVVTLENDYIKVMVLPEIGGKVWGAIDKSNGADFIYKNDVVKFRNIAMRGPWTSGGIEFNFGYIGHTPATATPVDYTTKQNEDGSVSCFVGSIDLPSRTEWRVEVRLQPDKSYFETHVQYYNPTNSRKSYYNWMTGAAHAKKGFEIIYPGNQSLSHGGDIAPWYINEDGIELNIYENNAFGSHISRHIVGAYEDFFGGYFHDEKRGFGHIAPYEEMPGQKLWLWALSRSGGIWEDLLTDTNGQYMEFQAGRMLNQFSPSKKHNPIAKAEFGPHTYDSWSEKWFPYREIGGMVDASDGGVLNVERFGSQVAIGINSFVNATATIQVKGKEEKLLELATSFTPNMVWMDTLQIEPGTDFDVTIEALDLSFSTAPVQYLDRDFNASPRSENTAALLFHEGLELKKNRRPMEALKTFQQVLDKDPYFTSAANSIAEIYYEQGMYDEALGYTRRALAVDTYDHEANFIAGNVYRAIGKNTDALECYGWAARSMNYRSAAYLEMGGIYLAENKYQMSKEYLEKSLMFNGANLRAMHLLAVVHRKLGNSTLAEKLLHEILQTDPLNHQANFELDLLRNNGVMKFDQLVRTELKYQSLLEIALQYYRYGLVEEAMQVLNLSPKHPLISGWQAFLTRSKTSISEQHLIGMTTASPEFVFPYRVESIDMLEWAAKQTNHWKIKYYLALNYWALNRVEKATALINDCTNEPDYSPFYIVRGRLNYGNNSSAQLDDVKKALGLNEKDWRYWDRHISVYFARHDYENALAMSTKAARVFPENYELGLKLVESHLHSKNYPKAISLLGKLEVLPFEGAGKGRELYEQALVLEALEKVKAGKYQQALGLIERARQWPENLGAGKPFDPDLRIEDFLSAYCLRKMKDQKAKDYEQRVMDYTLENKSNRSIQTILGLKILAAHDKYQSDSLVQKLSDHLGNEDPVYNWVVAMYSGNEKKAESYADGFGNDIYFRIVSQLLKLN